jgi:hypothetical protein
LDLIINLFVDDGNTERPYKNAMLNSEATLVAIKIGKFEKQKVFCEVAFAEKFEPNDKGKKAI